MHCTNLAFMFNFKVALAVQTAAVVCQNSPKRIFFAGSNEMVGPILKRLSNNGFVISVMEMGSLRKQKLA